MLDSSEVCGLVQLLVAVAVVALRWLVIFRVFAATQLASARQHACTRGMSSQQEQVGLSFLPHERPTPAAAMPV